MIINWRAIPALRLLIPLSLGILCSSLFLLSFYIVIAGSIVALTGLFFISRSTQIAYEKRFWFGAIASFCAFILGYWLVLSYDESYHSAYFEQSLKQGEPSQLIVQIDELPVRAKRVKIIAKVLEVNQQPCNGHILLYFDSDEHSLRLDYGDILAIQANPYRIPPIQNPYAFDFQNYMKLRNVRYSALVANNQYQTLAQRRGNPIMHFAYDSQESLLGVLAKYLPDEDDVFSVGAALILGSRNEISEETLNAYINTGAMHVLSVSGLHVGLVAMIFRRLIKSIKTQRAFWKYLDPALQLLFIWLFALITGASSCILRAAVMFSFAIVGRSLSRDANVYNMLAVSALFLLCYNPYFLFDVSFQLSYAGLLSIVYFYPYIYKFIINRFAFLSENKILNYLWEITALSLAAMIGTTPISIYYFHQFPTFFWLSGLIVVPLATVALGAGLLLFVVQFFNPIANIVGIVLYWVVWIMNKSLALIEQIPPGVQRHLWLDILGVCIAYFIIYSVGVALLKKEGKWLKIASLGLLALVLQYNYQKISSNRQNQMVIYSAGKDFIMDFIEGEKTIAIQSAETSERSIDFAAYNYRLAHRNSDQSIQTHLISDSLSLQNCRLLHQYCQYKDKSILFLDKPKLLENLLEQIKVDYLIIHNSPFLDFELLSQKIAVKKIIFTAANKVGSLNFYKKQCQNKGIEYYDIKEQGAFVELFNE